MVSKKPADQDLNRGNLIDLIAVASGAERGDVLLQHGRLVDVFSGTVRETNVLLHTDRIAGVGEYYTEAKEIIDCGGAYILPGLIDGHVHVESSHLTMSEFARAVLPCGTTSVIIDPHEIANVLGLPGIQYMLEASEQILLNVFIVVPSCVPATSLETSGAVLGKMEIEEALQYERIVGLGEMMNFPGVISGTPEVLDKLNVARTEGVIIDGHAPGVGGPDLNAYVAAGVGSDHECTTWEEAEEKLGLGLWIMIREGSAAKNLADLLPVVNPSTSRRCLFVTDDRHPEDLRREGHIDCILRKAVSLGLDPVTAIRMATLNTAEYFGLLRKGAVAPGYDADIVIMDDLEHFRVKRVIQSGRTVVHEEKIIDDIPLYTSDVVMDTVHLPQLSEESLRIEVKGSRARVIGLVEDQIITKQRIEDVRTDNGAVVSDVERDILKMAVIERHKGTGNIGLGLVQGFGLKSGAMASSVAHDSHNIIVVGINDRDMVAAVREIGEMGGGFVVAGDGQVIASLPLPIAGLISDQPLEDVCQGLNKVHQAALDAGVTMSSPFTTLSFLALPVIPELKLTDKGLIDVNAFQCIDLFE